MIFSVLLLVSNFLHAAMVKEPVKVTAIRLTHYHGVYPSPMFLKLNDIEPHAVVVRPTRELAKITNDALGSSRIANEARNIAFHYVNKGIHAIDTIIVLKGEYSNVLIFSPDGLLAVSKPDMLLEAVKKSMEVLGVWSKMDAQERHRLASHLLDMKKQGD